ncbi:MAG: DivIVA domain-containing protein [Syntrophobacteraceae bacterium]
MEITDIEQKKFSTRLMGLNPGEVEAFLGETIEELRRLKAENENLKRDLQAHELELREHKEREKTIRNVLVAAQKNAEQTRANAEREARLIVSEAEVKAEKILREGNERLMKMDREISELKRHRIQFGARVRTLLDTFRQILDESGEEKIGAPREEKPAAAAEPEA